MNKTSSMPQVRIVEIDENLAGQRIDNFLIKQLKGVPRTRLYRILRKGEVRVNGGRKKPTYKLCSGDKVRIPPIRTSPDQQRTTQAMLDAAVNIPVLYQDDALLVVDKPSGLAVHAGSGVDWGVIECLRAARSDEPFLELVHRLDRATSGCLMLARQRQALNQLHDMFREESARQQRIDKQYLALLQGRFKPARGRKRVDSRLLAEQTATGRKRVIVNAQGQMAHSVFELIESFESSTLVRVHLLSGRMHQARVHAQSLGHPIAGDDVYGDFSFNREMRKLGLKRLFLHAEQLRLGHPVSGKEIVVKSELPERLQQIIELLR